MPAFPTIPTMEDPSARTRRRGVVFNLTNILERPHDYHVNTPGVQPA